VYVSFGGREKAVVMAERKSLVFRKERARVRMGESGVKRSEGEKVVEPVVLGMVTVRDVVEAGVYSLVA